MSKRAPTARNRFIGDYIRGKPGAGFAEANAAYARTHSGGTGLAKRSSGDLPISDNPSGMAALLTPFNLAAAGAIAYVFNIGGFADKVKTAFHKGTTTA